MYKLRSNTMNQLTHETLNQSEHVLKSHIAFFNGNIGYTTMETCARVEELTADNMNKVIHVSGKEALVNFQISVRGTLKDGKIIVNYQNNPVECELYDLYIYAANHDFTIIPDCDDVTLVSAKFNKCHGIKRQLDLISQFIEDCDINVSAYDINTNDFITSFSGVSEDITKFIQSMSKMRGYNNAWITDRQTEVTFN